MVDLTDGKEVGKFGPVPPKDEQKEDRPGRFARLRASQAPLLQLSPDRRTAALVRAGGNGVHLLEVATGRELAHLKGHRGPITAMSFAPDGSYLITGSQEGTILVWSVAAPPDKGPSPHRSRKVPPSTTSALAPRWRS
jgi:WD40 repeat protein